MAWEQRVDRQTQTNELVVTMDSHSVETGALTAILGAAVIQSDVCASIVVRMKRKNARVTRAGKSGRHILV